MIYPYVCPKCTKSFEVYKSVEHYQSNETCPYCDNTCTNDDRIKFPKGQSFLNEKVEDAEYCPAMGQVVKSNKHRRQIAKENDMIEVGNEDPNKMHKYFEDRREEKRKDSYSEFFDNTITLRSR